MYRFKVRGQDKGSRLLLSRDNFGNLLSFKVFLSYRYKFAPSVWLYIIKVQYLPKTLPSPGGTFLKIAIRLSLLLIKNNIIATKVTILFNYQIEILIFFGKPFYFFLRLPAVFPLSFGLFNRSVSNFYFSFSKSYCFIPNKILLTNCFDG